MTRTEVVPETKYKRRSFAPLTPQTLASSAGPQACFAQNDGQSGGVGCMYGLKPVPSLKA